MLVIIIYFVRVMTYIMGNPKIYLEASIDINNNYR